MLWDTKAMKVMAIHSAQRWQTKMEVNEMLPVLDRGGPYLQVYEVGSACCIQMDNLYNSLGYYVTFVSKLSYGYKAHEGPVDGRWYQCAVSPDIKVVTVRFGRKYCGAIEGTQNFMWWKNQWPVQHWLIL